MNWAFWQRKEEQLDDEVQSHLRMAMEDRVARGEAPAQAERSVSREFGNVALVKEVTRDNWSWTWLERLLQDVRYGVRMLAKDPMYTGIAILTLALGIGANTALFSVINGVLLNPLPFPRPDELVAIHENKPNFTGGSSLIQISSTGKPRTTLSLRWRLPADIASALQASGTQSKSLASSSHQIFSNFSACNLHSDAHLHREKIELADRQ